MKYLYMILHKTHGKLLIQVFMLEKEMLIQEEILWNQIVQLIFKNKDLYQVHLKGVNKLLQCQTYLIWLIWIWQNNQLFNKWILLRTVEVHKVIHWQENHQLLIKQEINNFKNIWEDNNHYLHLLQFQWRMHSFWRMQITVLNNIFIQWKREDILIKGLLICQFLLIKVIYLKVFTYWKINHKQEMDILHSYFKIKCLYSEEIDIICLLMIYSF
jgi:hypothetical protein